MTENDDILIRDFFQQNYVEATDQKAFRRRVMRKLPSRYSTADRVVWLLLAIGAVAFVVWWTIGGSWIDAIASIMVSAKYAFSAVEISIAGVLKCLAAITVIIFLANYDFYYSQRYHSDDINL